MRYELTKNKFKENSVNFNRILNEILEHKKWQATYITPLQPNTFAVFPPWRIQRELVV
jgi:hypothetical protein